MKALVRFSLGRFIFDKGDEVNLPAEEIDYLLKGGLIAEGEGAPQTKEKPPGAFTLTEKVHKTELKEKKKIERPGEEK